MEEKSLSLNFVSALLAAIVLGMIAIDLISGEPTLTAYIIGISVAKMLADGHINNMVGVCFAAIVVVIKILEISLRLFAN